MGKKMYWAIDINNPCTWEEMTDDGEIIESNDDYNVLANIVANVEDYFELDDVYGMSVEELLDYTFKMVRE